MPLGDRNLTGYNIVQPTFAPIADRATLMTKIVLEAIKAFNIDLKQLHNDSTTVKAFGKYPRKTSTGFELKNGNSKDHRPDLKQLVFSLSISADGAVPIHYKSYPGNRTDDTTHIETWNTLHAINDGPDFLYVADCKVCTDKQLNHISQKEGRVVTLIPDNWKEIGEFKKSLRKEQKTKKEIWRRESLNDEKIDYFSLYDGEYLTNKRGYRIHWIFSTGKRKRDYDLRQKRLKKAEKGLEELQSKLNKRNLVTVEAIREAYNEILKTNKVDRFMNVNIGQISKKKSVQKGSGRPGPNTEYKTIVKTTYTLSWERNKEALKSEKNVDGVFPLLSTDVDLSAKKALCAYKYQPRLEKRFTQFKSVHNAAPLLFKKLERIEANMFLFFVALMIQALIEREVRNGMKDQQLKSIEIYPENRGASHPTTSKVFNIFSHIFKYTIVENEKVTERYADELNAIHKSILDLLKISETKYWEGINTDMNIHKRA